ncbi:TonB-dependent receptor [Candidatus Marinarcus aquaticus]|uniref:TonB-dependent siderophore receptor n=1 Tax=Candidatus Marinarcus aquaticus TaxID=2044504 RepID=A0A4Q0XTB3_9BACT|nr:TonB-dependent siderophore receptor [Candidatus Marinarcus aquaticus]RXJ57651.1 TonB-dependent siderophore receptor [Candidatus Marinarcus aquaticus]
MTPIKLQTLLLISTMLANSLYADEIKFDSVMVTANKVEENIQDVPQSITVINSTQIEEKGIKSITDVIREIPNMTATPLSGVAVNFRGLNASMFTNNNPVVIYIDGIPTSGRFSFDAPMANVERIEVLRGPQGTLYGKDAIGAVINIITKEPTNIVEGDVHMEYGSNNYMRGLFNIYGPIIEDKLFFGFNTEQRRNDGWITNQNNGDDKANKQEYESYNASLHYKATDRLSAKLVLKREEAEENWIKGYAKSAYDGLSDFKRDEAENVNFDMPTYEENTIDSQSLKLEYEADTFTINSITTHKNTEMIGEYDAEYSNNPMYAGLKQFMDNEIDTYTQEIRLSSNNSEGIRWISGVYFDKEDSEMGPYGMEFPNYLSTPPYTYIGNYRMNAPSETKSKTQAIFGQVMIPFAEDFELTLGGRYQKIEKKIDMKLYYLPVGTTGTPFYTLNDETSWNVFLPKVALSHKINGNFTTYISVSKGYMPGGYNFFGMSGSIEDNSFDPQKSTNYEAGIKGTIDNFVFTASIFKMDIEDIHVYKSTGTGVYITDNADKAHSQGIEFDFTYFPNDNWEISGAFGFIKAQYDDYDGGTFDFDGEKIENTPSHTASLSVAYYHPQGYYGRTDLKNQGNTYFYNDKNKEMLKQSSNTTVDIKLGYRFSDFDIYAYGRNITDEEYLTSFTASSSFARATFNDPRSFGVGLKYSF